MSHQPLTIIVFGGTGDLFQKKLAGALFGLWQKKLLPARAEIIGFSRKPLTHAEFRAFIERALGARGQHHAAEIKRFTARAFYHQGDLHSPESYQSLSAFLEARDRARGVCSDKVFYLAVPPHLYEGVFTRLSASGLALPCAPGMPDDRQAWTRVLVEKPFGNNAPEAARLDRLLGALFAEEQIFRIDHYLAKEAMQNIVSFRFSNGLFEPLWNRKHIERVEIMLLQKDGVADRGAFYDSVGALRDVGQNHLLQMLALAAMEHPKKLEARAMRRARADVFQKTRVRARSLVRGQYDGYKTEAGVAPGSDTETYFAMEARVGSRRWKGVPFLLTSGKALRDAEVSISVFFKPAPCLCPDAHAHAHQNALSFRISPKEEIAALFWAKRPGFNFQLEPKELSFSFGEGMLAHQIPDAYERVLYDCIRGDQTLFASTEEVNRQWNIITPLLRQLKKLPLRKYAKGSAGPR